MWILFWVCLEAIGVFFFFLRLHLFIFTERRKEGGSERNIDVGERVISFLSRAPNWGPGLQPRHVPWLGIQLVTLWFAGLCLIHWATPAREHVCFNLKASLALSAFIPFPVHMNDDYFMFNSLIIRYQKIAYQE